MAGRDLTLAPRAEGSRDSRPALQPVQFSLPEIRRHFNDSLDTVKGQYEVADSLKSDGNIKACKAIWRSQVVFAEGLLDFHIHEISKYCLFRMFSGLWDQSEKYKSFLVPMSNVEEAISAVESRDWFFRNTEEMSTAYGKTVVKELFTRRDEIVHQNDRSHASAEQADITKEFVDDYIGKVESIVKAIHEIAEEKDGGRPC